MKVLFAEDNEDLRAMYRAHIELCVPGVQVTTADDGTEAIARGTNGVRFALAILDVHMPGESGVEAARLIRAAKPLLPIVFLTGDPGAVPQETIDELSQTAPCELWVKPGCIGTVGANVRRLTGADVEVDEKEAQA